MIFGLLCALSLVGHSDAKALRLPTFVDSHMVLQREPFSSRIWGWASPGANVTASLDGGMTHGASVVDADGSWSINLPPQPASDGHTLLITDGETTIDLLDIAFGDVYLCSGQSNMVMSVPDSFNASEEIADSINYPNLRLATVQMVTADTPQDDVPSKSLNYTWARSGPDAVGIRTEKFDYFSATCYFFGRDLYKAHGGKVPIGLVSSCWGGQRIETFSSPDALADESCGGTRPLGMDFQSPDKNVLRRAASLRATSSPDGVWFRPDSREQRESLEVQPKDTQLWNAMIHPLLPMRFLAALWYQGEANAGDPPSYSCRFPAMIADWRRKFDLPELSFFYVELAPLKDYAWSNIRAAQRAASQLPNVGFATTIDLGDPSSPFGGVHSRRKQEVGRRLSLAVRSVQYEERGGLVYTGPSLAGVQFTGGCCDSGTEIRLSFVPGTADGLHLHQTPECDKCCSEPPFQVLNSTGAWVRVDHGFQRGLDMYLSTRVAPVYGIRYAWESYPQCIMYNGDGGPDDHTGIAAAPFEWCALPSGKPAWTGDGCRVADASIGTYLW
jgi:sialate O-acetylesterase